jgi:hypothetical protein
MKVSSVTDYEIVQKKLIGAQNRLYSGETKNAPYLVRFIVDNGLGY